MTRLFLAVLLALPVAAFPRDKVPKPVSAILFVVCDVPKGIVVTMSNGDVKLFPSENAELNALLDKIPSRSVGTVSTCPQSEPKVY